MNDPRVNFVCLDFPEFALHIDPFEVDSELDDKLNNFVIEILG